jgi:hypothetical protein
VAGRGGWPRRSLAYYQGVGGARGVAASVACLLRSAADLCGGSEDSWGALRRTARPPRPPPAPRGLVAGLEGVHGGPLGLGAFGAVAPVGSWELHGLGAVGAVAPVGAWGPHGLGAVGAVAPVGPGSRMGSAPFRGSAQGCRRGAGGGRVGRLPNTERRRPLWRLGGFGWALRRTARPPRPPPAPRRWLLGLGVLRLGGLGAWFWEPWGCLGSAPLAPLRRWALGSRKVSAPLAPRSGCQGGPGWARQDSTSLRAEGAGSDDGGRSPPYLPTRGRRARVVSGPIAAWRRMRFGPARTRTWN